MGTFEKNQKNSFDTPDRDTIEEINDRRCSFFFYLIIIRDNWADDSGWRRFMHEPRGARCVAEQILQLSRKRDRARQTAWQGGWWRI